MNTIIPLCAMDIRNGGGKEKKVKKKKKKRKSKIGAAGKGGRKERRQRKETKKRGRSGRCSGEGVGRTKKIRDAKRPTTTMPRRW